MGFGELFGLGSPFAFLFAGTRDTVGGGAGAREDCRELSPDMGSILGGAGFDSREGFRGFATAGVGVSWGAGSALERILEKAIGSAGLLGVWWLCTLDALFAD